MISEGYFSSSRKWRIPARTATVKEGDVVTHHCACLSLSWSILPSIYPSIHEITPPVCPLRRLSVCSSVYPWRDNSWEFQIWLMVYGFRRESNRFHANCSLSVFHWFVIYLAHCHLSFFSLSRSPQLPLKRKPDKLDILRQLLTDIVRLSVSAVFLFLDPFMYISKRGSDVMS